MLTRDEYLLKKEKCCEEIKKVNADSFRLDYHLMPQFGWLNDPNGLCQFNGVYHIYHQYAPFTITNGKNIMWGHYTTKDFINYVQEEPFIYPDTKDDQDGAYSGSCLIKDNKMYFYYTGNVKYQDKEYDYINEGREHNTILVESNDGYNYQQKEVLLVNDDYPKEMTKHVRDPKIYQKDNQYYMVLGARDKIKGGCLLIYKSDDLRNFKYYNTIYPKEKFGYMWECPDLIELNNELFLICCPQGLEQDGDKYQSVYQNGYFKLKYNFQENKYQLFDFYELDYGFDFYAPQTFCDQKNRTILYGWMGIPDADYTNPTVDNGWQHCLTIPREIINIDGYLYQKPLEELKNLRKNKKIINDNNLLNLNNNHSYELILFPENNDFKLQLRKDVFLTYENNVLKLIMGASGYGRKERYIIIDEVNKLQIFSDNSSLEIFINDGIKTMTTRTYAYFEKNDLSLECKKNIMIEFYELDKIKIKGE